MITPCSFASCETRIKSSRVQLIAKRGAKQHRIRPSACPCHFRMSATDSLSEEIVCSRNSAGTSSPLSIMHLPTVARNPVSSTTRRTSSVKRTVSIVRAHVVPPLMSSATPSWAEARIDSGVCAASIGQTRFFSQSISARSSAAPRNNVWQR